MSGNFISFADWKAENPDLVEQVRKECDECDVCQGDGSCWVCGNDCDECSSAGMDRKLHKLYMQIREEQSKKLEAWNAAIRELA